MAKLQAINLPRVADIKPEVQPTNEQLQEETKKSPVEPKPPSSVSVNHLFNKKKNGAVKHTISMSPSEWEFLEKLARKFNHSEPVLMGDIEKTTPSELIRWGISLLIKQKKFSAEELISWRKQKYEISQNLSQLLSEI